MFKTKHLTKGEHVVLELLQANPGEKFTPYTIEEKTGVRSETIPRIVSNLRIKGHEIRMQYGRYWVPVRSTMRGLIVLIVLFSIIGTLFIIEFWEAMNRAL